MGRSGERQPTLHREGSELFCAERPSRVFISSQSVHKVFSWVSTLVVSCVGMAEAILMGIGAIER